MSATVIESLADVRPGDIMLTSMSGAPARAAVYGGQLLLGEYVRLGRFVVGHVGIVTHAAQPNGYHDPILVQAMPRGAESREITELTHWNTHTRFARLPEDWPGQATDAAEIARRMVGIPYSFASYAALAAWRFGLKAERLERWIDRRQVEPLKLSHWSNGPTEPRAADGRITRGGHLPVEAICSVLADQAWSLAGKRVCRDVARQTVTPGQLTLQLLATPGVIWGGKGWGL